ncbi:hypothetical protein HUO13_05540 [Saccharopolyspora erythraea]|uniref:hypothetical protein n=1 Tax=Saccharopolyspora erythraea TaxID=1836 RepID=UPI001BA9FCBD|nr:hypothetical protein [Saccharopolyspora erythraea]QUH00352.1 hypothetical protein HUO13_05540 [Saccharopolyspora erythraea]
MHRSWLRTKLAETGTKVTGKVTERAKAVVPFQLASEDSCMVCGRTVRRHHTVRGDGRVCSPACARTWAEGL